MRKNNRRATSVSSSDSSEPQDKAHRFEPREEESDWASSSSDRSSARAEQKCLTFDLLVPNPRVFSGAASCICAAIMNHKRALQRTIAQISTPGKGILAADEWPALCETKFSALGIPNTAETRRMYRVVMLSPAGVEKYISGVIFDKETLKQNIGHQMTFVQHCERLGIVPGVNSEGGGLVPFLEGVPGEEVCEGLDGYTERLRSLKKLGIRFCKWRHVYRIQDDSVSEALVQRNAETHARYAVLSQLEGIVPIVEPEVMVNGSHSIDICQRISEYVWAAVVTALQKAGALFEFIILKPSMVVPGIDANQPADPDKVARRTLRALGRTIPAALPCVAFLSGGLSDQQSTSYLNAMNQENNQSDSIKPPWYLTFSFGRALQFQALQTWSGADDRVELASRVFMHRAKMNSQATLGKYRTGNDEIQF